MTNAQNQANATSQLIGSNEPITATTIWFDDNNVQQTYTDTYNWKAGNYDTQYMEENGDGSYDIYIERFSDVDWNEGAYLFFTYNPANGSITNKSTGQYWDWNLSYNDNVYYSESYGAVINITNNGINTTTGDINISVNATGDATYTSTYSYYTPNNIGTVSTNFTFVGKLKVFPLQ